MVAEIQNVSPVDVLRAMTIVTYTRRYADACGVGMVAPEDEEMAWAEGILRRTKYKEVLENFRTNCKISAGWSRR